MVDPDTGEHTRCSEDPMIRHTMRRVAKKLDHFLSYDIPIARSFDMLEAHARTVEEMVVIEVMRESYKEVREEASKRAVQADSRSRTARMPSIALSR